jgi:outer membrane immunogenic protein
MKKTLRGIAVFAALAATPALAADLALKAPAPPPAWSWAGFYIGGNVGGAWGATDSEVPSGVFTTTATGQAFPASITRSGLTAGGQFGYNWQIGSTVFGLEADANYLGLNSKSVSIPEPHSTFFGSGASPNVQTYGVSSENFFGTFRGRLGYAWDRVLLYATGGLAYGPGANNSVTYTNASPGVNYAIFKGNSGSGVGWTAGGGLEYALGNNWSVRGEYLYVDLNNHSRTLLPATVVGTAATGASFTDSGGSFSIARIGVNYKFGSP